MSRETTETTVEWLILADSAQVVGSKLFLLGGGWDVLTINSGFPIRHHMAVAASFRVPWGETNQKHTTRIQLDTEDGKTILQIDGQFEVGRPPGIKPGQDQRLQIAADLAVQFDRPGTYVFVAGLKGEELARTHFNVVPGPMMALKTAETPPK